jgi:uracil-DNA glycosylase family 4
MSELFRAVYSEMNFLNMLRGRNTDLSGMFPFIPANSEGLPPPGIDFINYSELLSNPGIDYKTNEFELQQLYYRAMYDDKFSLPLAYMSRMCTMPFITGGLWYEPPMGPQPCDVMLVYKHATKTDVERRAPLTGSAGELLEQCFCDVGLGSEVPIYVTPVIKHDHPDPKSTNFKACWIKNCGYILQQEIRIVRPKYIMLMGSEAIAAVLGRTHTISNTQGRVLTLNYIATDGEVVEAKVVTSINPSIAVRKPEKLDDVKSAVAYFARVVRNENLVTDNIDHRAIRSVDELVLLKNEILSSPDNNIIAVDAEWNGAYPGEKNSYVRTVQISWKPGKAACVVIHTQGGKEEITGGVAAAVLELRQILQSTEDRKVRVVGHYLNADMPWLLSIGLDIRPDYLAPIDDTDPNGIDRLFGYQKTKTEGGFDTLLAAHSVNETGDFKLEVLGTRLAGVPRYDVDLQKWKKSYCEENDLDSESLEGYGDCPDDVIIPYGNYDADTTRRLFDIYNGTPTLNGLLDCDSYGNSSRVPFWISSRAALAFGEMHMSGLAIDLDAAESLTDHYVKTRDMLLAILRENLKWPEFNPNSVYHCREMLFGVKYNSYFDKETFKPKQVRPEGAVSLELMPYKSTGKRPKLWREIIQKGQESENYVSTDKEVLQMLADKHPCVELLRDIRYIAQLTRYVLRPGKGVEEGEAVRGDDGRIEHESGLLSYVLADGRVRSQFFQTKETGRASSARPPLQNLGKTAEEKYKAVFKRHGERIGLSYKFPLRSIVKARPGHVFVDADYTGAELAIMAWQSGDENMIDHVRRSGLPESDPNYYDIHSNVAVSAFSLACAPTKKGLASIGKSALRTAAKAVVFGYAYGQQAEATSRKAKQEGADVSVEQAQQLIDGLVAMYPALPHYFQSCRDGSQDRGYIANCFGRYRRFAPAREREVISEQQRQAMNFPIQSAVADAMSRALDHLYWYRYETDNTDFWYDIVLQVHDAVVLEVPVNSVDWVVNEVLPICMSDMVDVYPCRLDGTRYTNAGPYHLQVPPPDIFVKWSVPITKEECRKLGISESYGA